MNKWKQLNDDYFINKNGMAKSIRKGYIKILEPTITHAGYLQISMYGKTYLLHRLLAETFIPNPMNLPEVNHKDGINLILMFLILNGVITHKIWNTLEKQD
jgi:hypothetical protein